MCKPIFSFLLLAVIFMSCRDSSSKNNKPSDVNPGVSSDSNTAGADTADLHQNSPKAKFDTIIKDTAKRTEPISVNGWKIDDFIINPKDKSSESLRLSIENMRDEWKNVKSPFVATYQGCNFGDYFHIIFKDAKGKSYDFGYAHNTYGKYILFDKTDYTDNPKYLNRTFIIHWNWMIASFPCCEGDYDKVEAYIPSITGLELTGTKAGKK